MTYEVSSNSGRKDGYGVFASRKRAASLAGRLKNAGIEVWVYRLDDVLGEIGECRLVKAYKSPCKWRLADV